MRVEERTVRTMRKRMRAERGMVLILDGNTEHVAEVGKKIVIVIVKEIRFATALDLIKCR